MKKYVIAVIAILALAGSGIVITRAIQDTPKNPASRAAVILPPAYDNLDLGLTKSQVLAMIGRPKVRSLNPRFEVKSPQEWAAIGAQLAISDPSAADSSAVPNRTSLKLGALYEHRIKETWRYEPSGKFYEEVAFDGAGHVCNLTKGPVMQSMQSAPKS